VLTINIHSLDVDDFDEEDDPDDSSYAKSDEDDDGIARDWLVTDGTFATVQPLPFTIGSLSWCRVWDFLFWSLGGFQAGYVEAPHMFSCQVAV
jgi:hypothetical protein